MATRVPNKPRQSPKSDAPPREAEMGDNSAAMGEEDERVQLISYVTKLTQTAAGVEAAKAPFEAAKKAHTQVFRLAKAAGFSRKELEKRMEEMNVPTREMAVEVTRERKHRRWLGIIDDEQQALQLGAETPQPTKDEYHWRSEGYKAGLRGLLRKAPAGCTGDYEQAYLAGYDTGKKDGSEAIAKNLKPSVREQAAADFKEEHPEFDPVAAAKKLKNDPKFMDRSAPPEIVDNDPLGANGDGFAATEEELAAQKARPSTQDAEAEAQAASEAVV